MNNTLLAYMNRRFGEAAKLHHGKPVPGPVITISREAGCGGLNIAEKLSYALNQSSPGKKWQVISKEILHQSASELKIDPQRVKRVFSPKESSSFNEIMEAFNMKSYKSERAILNTIKDVIRTFAVDGSCIILGRGGREIAYDIEQSLHIRLIAPLEWRIDKVASRKKISHPQAREFVIDLDQNREAFRKNYLSKKNPQEHFDITIDVSKFETDKLVLLLKAAAELKGITEKLGPDTTFSR